MRSLEKGQDKIQKICDKLRHEVIDPAKKEAQQIIESARQEARDIKAEAEKNAEQSILQAKSHMEQERNVFLSSLQQASKQTLEKLRQEIESHFFNNDLQQLVEKHTADPQIIANILNAFITSIKKEGLQTDLTAIVPHTVSSDDIITLLLEEVKKNLKNHPLELGDFAGGARVKMHGKNMTLDLTDQTIKELLASFVRKDFRKVIFSQ